MPDNNYRHILSVYIHQFQPERIGADAAMRVLQADRLEMRRLRIPARRICDIERQFHGSRPHECISDCRTSADIHLCAGGLYPQQNPGILPLYERQNHADNRHRAGFSMVDWQKHHRHLISRHYIPLILYFFDYFHQSLTLRLSRQISF